jgi:hypothetical protein
VILSVDNEIVSMMGMEMLVMKSGDISLILQLRRGATSVSILPQMMWLAGVDSRSAQDSSDDPKVDDQS